MSSGGRCAPGSCQSSTTTPAIVYFPAGTYIINSSIVDYYYTQIIGNPNSLPVLKATAKFSGFGLIDGDRYGGAGLQFGATNVFYRQVRNIIFDLTGIPASSAATGIRKQLWVLCSHAPPPLSISSHVLRFTPYISQKGNNTPETLNRKLLTPLCCRLAHSSSYQHTKLYFQDE